MFSMTGVAASWSPSCQGVGCPSAANAIPQVANRAAIPAATLDNREIPIIVYQLLRRMAAIRAAPPARGGALETIRCDRGHKGGSCAGGAAQQGRSRASSNHNSALLAMCLMTGRYAT